MSKQASPKRIADRAAGVKRAVLYLRVSSSTPLRSTCPPGREVLTELCELLSDPQELYRQASRRDRRSLNKVIFTRLYLDADEVGRVIISGDELNDGVAPIVNAERGRPVLVGARREDSLALPVRGADENGVLPEEDAMFSEVSLTDLVDLALGQRCSSKAVMVELMTRYSNNPTVLDDLRHARETVLSPDEDDEPEAGGERRASGWRQWAVADRLAADGIQSVVDGYRAGRSTQELAERFKISTSSIKRLVRRAGCGRRDMPLD